MSDGLGWPVIAVLSVGIYAERAAGMFVLGPALRSERAMRVLAAVPVAVIAAVVALQTFTVGDRLAVDARVPGVVAAALAVWGRAPLAVAVVLAAVVTATVRALGWAA